MRHHLWYSAIRHCSCGGHASHRVALVYFVLRTKLEQRDTLLRDVLSVAMDDRWRDARMVC